MFVTEGVTIAFVAVVVTVKLCDSGATVKLFANDVRWPTGRHTVDDDFCI